jgi:O-antigen/teichoic acid export membrane protein
MKTNLKKNVFTIAIASFSSKILSFLLVPLYTTFLSTEEYGIIDIIFTSVSLLLPIFSMIIFEAMLRFALDNGTDKETIFTNGIIINLIGAIFFLLVSFPITSILSISDFYVYFIFYFLSVILYDSLSYFSRGINKVKNYAIAGVINTILIISLNIFFLIVFKLGIKGYLLSYIIATIISSSYLFCVLKLHQFFKIKKFDKILLKQMMQYSLPMIPNSITWWVNTSLDKFVILFVLGQAATGLYAIGYKIPSLITLIVSVFNSAWLLSSVENFGSNESKNYYKEIFSKYSSFLIVITTLIIFSAKFSASVLYRGNFYSAWVYVPSLAISVFYHGFATFFGSIFTAIKKTKHLFYSTLIGAIVNVILNIILIPLYGSLIAAVTTALSYFIIFLYRFYVGRKYFEFDIKKISLLIQCILVFILAFIVTIDFDYSLILTVPIFLIIVLFNINYIRYIIKTGLTIIKRRI